MDNTTLVSRVMGLSSEMRIINGMKKKFASPNCKLLRICAETGNVNKLERLLASYQGSDVLAIRFVSHFLPYCLYEASTFPPHHRIYIADESF